MGFNCDARYIGTVRVATGFAIDCLGLTKQCSIDPQPHLSKLPN